MARRACQRVPVRQGLCPRGYLPIGRLHYPNTVSGNRLENLVKRLATKRHAGDMRAMRLQTRLTDLPLQRKAAANESTFGLPHTGAHQSPGHLE